MVVLIYVQHRIARLHPSWYFSLPNPYAMKRLLFLFLLVSVSLAAQTNLPRRDTVPAGAVRIVLPEPKLSYRFNGNERMVRSDAAYKALFADSVHARLPAIDFRQYELLGKAYCMQCAAHCDHHPQCHRNACRYTREWYLVDRRDRIALSADTLLNIGRCNLFSLSSGLVCRNDSGFSVLQQKCPALKNKNVDFSKSVVLACGVFADCAANIQHELYLDTAARCVVWRMFITYGRCHSMLERDFVFAVPNPPAGYTVAFEPYLEPEWD